MSHGYQGSGDFLGAPEKFHHRNKDLKGVFNEKAIQKDDYGIDVHMRTFLVNSVLLCPEPTASFPGSGFIL